MSERRGPKALELWCRRITEGYPGVNVQNMTTSWRDGLAFCAMIHHFRPDLIDFSSLNKDDIYGNNELAFRTAEQHLGIPALLDAEDMASCSVPDRLSILTYLSQFYQQFGGSSPSRLARSRTPDSSAQKITPADSPASKAVPRLGMRRESCVVCSLPVFLAEKLVISKSTYHRTCFRCARCHNQLTPCSYYETEEGQYCCETCPDEDTPDVSIYPIPDQPKDLDLELDLDQDHDQDLNYHRSLSDEEKLTKSKDLTSSRIASLRLNFMSSSLLTDDQDQNQDQDQDKSLEPKDVNVSPDKKHPHGLEPETKDINLHSMTSRTNDKVVNNSNGDSDSVKVNRCLTATSESLDKDSVINVDDYFIVNDKNKSKDEVKNQDTKEMVGETGTEVSQCLSIVQKRLKLFQDLVDSSNVSINDDDDDVDESKEEEEEGVSGASRIEPDSLDGFTLTEAKSVSQEVATPANAKADLSTEDQQYPDDMNPFRSDDEADGNPERSTNPFGSDSDDDVEEEPPKPKARSAKRLLKAPVNPFLSDEEEEYKLEAPVPKPRSSSNSDRLSKDGFYASSSSLASSTGYRKRRPAPPPPDKATPEKNDSGIRTPRPRKSKPAPPPPMTTSSPLASGLEKLSLTSESSTAEESLNKLDINATEDTDRGIDSWEDIKVCKNEANRTKQSLSRSESGQDYTKFDKSSHGKWKRKKAQAPARPIPQRRKIRVMSMKDVKMELAEIEMQQLGLEKQGVRLEQLIRNKCENEASSEKRDSGDNMKDNNDSSLSMDADELVMELFALVNEKNEIFRRQAELMLLKRQHRLEEEHADIEYQIRCLMCQPEATKTDFDKQREEGLIQRLVEIVEKRSEIVECLEMDRKREVEEDKSINMHMELYTAKKGSNEEQKTHKGKKLKLKEKFHIKEKHLLKKGHKKDADKDVDETEVKVKRQNKRKWF
ncbi:MICAL-like protein 1 isoform X2 [Cotesia glomerata]|uniref:MICAL-like protein 1 isoform X2 n=1 Tax=Cotesia glomerata TaxID=32391 RepID=UPI001D008B1B|nr:MICAL-like protein 1 isoform X2 [Cotesia glomerata]